MERRLTAFVIPVLLLLIGFSVFAGPGGDDPAATVDPAAARPAGAAGGVPASVQDESGVFTRTFGEPGGVGFRVEFYVNGGSVRNIWLLDHEQLSVEGAEDERVPYQIVQPLGGGVPNLLLQKGRGTDKFGGTPLYAEWQHEDLDDGQGVRFWLETESGLVLERTYRWDPGRRDLWLEIGVRSPVGRTDVGAPVQLRLRGVALPNPRRNYVLGSNPAKGVAGLRLDGEEDTVFVRPNELEAGEKRTIAGSTSQTTLRYGGTTNRFFTAQLYPADEDGARAWHTILVTASPSRPLMEGDEVVVEARSIPVALYDLRLDVPAEGQTSRAAYRLYLGPKSKRVFSRSAAPDEYERFGPVVDYDLQPIGCWMPGAQPIARFLLWVLGLFQDLIGNWGIAIVVLTICVRSALVPLNFRMQKAMRAYGARAAAAAPEMEKIKQKYKDDPKQLQMAMLQFQREKKLFPPVGGCLPLFVTIPIFIGLFSMLRASYDLRGQPFFGWVDDLSQPDRLAVVPMGPLGEVPLNLLPILWCSLTFYLQSQAPLPKDPQQRSVMRIMRLMPLLFGVFLYNYASGLLLYMLTSGFYALVETRTIKRILGPMPETPMGATPMPM